MLVDTVGFRELNRYTRSRSRQRLLESTEPLRQRLQSFLLSISVARHRRPIDNRRFPRERFEPRCRIISPVRRLSTKADWVIFDRPFALEVRREPLPASGYLQQNVFRVWHIPEFAAASGFRLLSNPSLLSVARRPAPD